MKKEFFLSLIVLIIILFSTNQYRFFYPNEKNDDMVTGIRGKLYDQTFNFTLDKNRPSLRIFESQNPAQAYKINLTLEIFLGKVNINYKTADYVDYPCCEITNANKPGNYSFSISILEYVDLSLPRQALNNGTVIFTEDKVTGNYRMSSSLTTRSGGEGLNYLDNILLWISFLLPFLLAISFIILVIYYYKHSKKNL